MRVRLAPNVMFYGPRRPETVLAAIKVPTYDSQINSYSQLCNHRLLAGNRQELGGNLAERAG